MAFNNLHRVAWSHPGPPRRIFLQECIETQNLGKDQTLPALPTEAALVSETSHFQRKSIKDRFIHLNDCLYNDIFWPLLW